jgi:hypothetical protein
VSDIFVSYAREDQLCVEPLTTHLERAGWSVWCDRRLQPGEPFDGVIEREVAAARIVLVLRSKHSVWDGAEANPNFC